MNALDFKITIVELVIAGKYKISEHALDALIDDELERADVSDSIAESEILENYPDLGKAQQFCFFRLQPMVGSCIVCGESRKGLRALRY